MALYARAYNNGLEALFKRGSFWSIYEGTVTGKENGKKIKKKTSTGVELTASEIAAIGVTCGAGAVIAFECWKSAGAGSIVEKIAKALHVKPSDIGEGLLKLLGVRKRSLLLDDGGAPTELKSRAADSYLHERGALEIDMDLLDARDFYEDEE